MKVGYAALLGLLGMAVASCTTEMSRATSDADKWDAHFSVRFPRQKILGLLTNADLDWEESSIGLEPHLSPNAESVLPLADQQSLETVRSWLRDPNRFALAHVLLTLSRKEGASPITSREWNTLRVTTLGGAAHYDPAQIEQLQRKWAPTAAVAPSR